MSGYAFLEGTLKYYVRVYSVSVNDEDSQKMVFDSINLIFAPPGWSTKLLFSCTPACCDNYYIPLYRAVWPRNVAPSNGGSSCQDHCSKLAGGVTGRRTMNGLEENSQVRQHVFHNSAVLQPYLARGAAGAQQSRQTGRRCAARENYLCIARHAWNSFCSPGLSLSASKI